MYAPQLRVETISWKKAMALKQYFVYNATDERGTVLYASVTSDLFRRMVEYKTKTFKGLTSKCNIDKLVHCGVFKTPQRATLREKQIKGGFKGAKEELIKRTIPIIRI